jgi:hypothetical protein
MSTFNQTANHNIVLKAARDIGVSMTNIGAEDLTSGQVSIIFHIWIKKLLTPLKKKDHQHLVMALLWQITRAGLEKQMQKVIDTQGLTGSRTINKTIIYAHFLVLKLRV